MEPELLQKSRGFTEMAKRAVLCGQVEALRLRESYTGPEHILLALLDNPGNLVVLKLLPRLGISAAEVRDRLHSRLTRSSVPLDKDVMLAGKLTPAADQALTYAREEAARFDCPRVSTSYLLLGLLREADSPAARVLVELGVATDALRSIIAESPLE